MRALKAIVPLSISSLSSGSTPAVLHKREMPCISGLTIGRNGLIALSNSAGSSGRSFFSSLGTSADSILLSAVSRSFGRFLLPGGLPLLFGRLATLEVLSKVDVDVDGA